MSEVFGSRGKKGSSSETPSATGSTRTKPTAQGENCYIEYDNETGEMRLTLPPHLAQYKNELARDLYEEYFLANPDESTMGSISEYIDHWLATRAEQDG